MGTLLLLLMAVAAWGQNPATTVQNTNAKLNTVQPQKQTAAKVAPANGAKPATASTVAVHKAAPNSAKLASVKPTRATVKPAVATSAVKVVPAKVAQTSAKPVATKSAQPSVKPAVAVSAKKVNVAAKPAHSPVKTGTVAKAVVTSKPVAVKPVQVALKPAVVANTKVVANAKVVAKTKIVAVPKGKTSAPAAVKAVAAAKVDVKDTSAKPEGSEKEKKESSGLINVVGKRDPFLSPVMNQSMTGSGCSVGKKCLAIDQITVRGIVKADSGMIAVVVNALDKAYFLRENDPVFNGYVEKITEDSIVFKEMYQDKLGKAFTRDVTKRIPAPVV
jgi:hypothetical protein